MRWHSYQSLVVRARRKRVGRARPLGVVPNSFVCDYDHEHEQEAEAAEEEEL